MKTIEKGIVVTGEGKERTILFINNGEFITNKSNKKLKKVNFKLTKEQQAVFLQDGGIIRDKVNGKLDKFVNELTKKAKLNIDIKMIGIEAILDEILQNPEVYGFTAGCAVYYLPKTKGQETDISLISKNITGNAVIIKETDKEFFSYLIKEGMLVKKQDKPVQVKFELSEVNQIRLRKKLKQHTSEKGMVKLAGMEDIHDICIIDIIKPTVEHYNSFSADKIVLTNISDSVLESIKKEYLNRNDIFWDDLHPARRLHELLALKTTEFIKKHYALKNPPSFRDDSTIGAKAKLLESIYAEAPGNIGSSRSAIRGRGC